MLWWSRHKLLGDRTQCGDCCSNIRGAQRVRGPCVDTGAGLRTHETRLYFANLSPGRPWFIVLVNSSQRVNGSCGIKALSNREAPPTWTTTCVSWNTHNAAGALGLCSHGNGNNKVVNFESKTALLCRIHPPTMAWHGLCLSLLHHCTFPFAPVIITNWLLDVA